MSPREQLCYWVEGIPIHNVEREECTPDFSCCGIPIADYDRRQQFQRAFLADDNERIDTLLSMFLSRMLVHDRHHPIVPIEPVRPVAHTAPKGDEAMDDKTQENSELRNMFAPTDSPEVSGRAAHNLISQIILHHRARADALEELLDCLPGKLPKNAGEALTTLLLNHACNR